MANSEKDIATIKSLQSSLAAVLLYGGRIDGLFGGTCRKAFITMVEKISPEMDTDNLPSNTYESESVFTFIQTALAGVGLYSSHIDGVWGTVSQKGFDDLILLFHQALEKSIKQSTLPLGFATLSTSFINEEQLKAMLPKSNWDKVDTCLAPLNEAMDLFEINTPLRIAHFMAQILHETSYFTYSEEIASGKAYEGRTDLGNTKPGDGVLFKGRAWLQITGRDNYVKCQAYLRQRLNDPTIDITSNAKAASQLATNPLYSALASGYFWGFIKPKLNPTADKDDIYWVSVYVNGWAKQDKPYYPNRKLEPNHMKERVEMLAVTKKALGLI